jgi:hypothetical protein
MNVSIAARQTSVTAGTTMHRSKLPLTTRVRSRVGEGFRRHRRSTPLPKYGSSNTRRQLNAVEDHEPLLTLYDFPAEHSKHLSASSPGQPRKLGPETRPAASASPQFRLCRIALRTAVQRD